MGCKDTLKIKNIYSCYVEDAQKFIDDFWNPVEVDLNKFDGVWTNVLNKNGVMKKEEKIKQLQDQLESVKQEIEDLKNKKEVLRWEDLYGIDGYYTDIDGTTKRAITANQEIRYNVFKTEEQAEAAIALAKISQLLPIYNEDAFFHECNSYIEISKYKKSIAVYTYPDDYSYHRNFLRFKDQDIALKFLEHNRDLIEQAKPLL